MGKQISELDQLEEEILETSVIPIQQDAEGFKTFYITIAQLKALILTWFDMLPEDTYANWETKRAAGTLPKGYHIKITDRGDKGIVVYCNTVNSFSLEGSGGFLNPDFQSVGDYEGVETVTSVPYTATKGVWYIGGEGDYEDGDVVFWNGLHYQVISAGDLNETAPTSNADAFQVLPKASEDVGYIEEWDTIQYDFKNDLLIYRADLRGNKVEDNVAIGYGSIEPFQWGNNNVMFNRVYDSAAFYMQNNRGVVFSTTTYKGANAQIDNTHEGSISACTFGRFGSTFFNLDSGKSMNGCIIELPNFGPAIDPSKDYASKRCEAGFSDFEASVDLTDPTIYHSDTKTLNLSTFSYQGIIHLSADGASITIDNIDGAGFLIPRTFDAESSETPCDIFFEDNIVGAGNIYIALKEQTLEADAGDGIIKISTIGVFCLQGATGSLRDRIGFEFTEDEARCTFSRNYQLPVEA